MRANLLVIFILCSFLLHGQNEAKSIKPLPEVDSIRYDSLHISKGLLFLGPDLIVLIPTDITILVKKYSLNEVDMNMIAATKTFYDSVQQKLGRHKVSRFLYSLAFVSPKIATLPDTIQIVKSEVPFKKYKGKIIRRIQIKTLDPFGPTVIDTAAQSMTWAGRTGNNIHRTTRQYVIRKNLLFKPGQMLDPLLLADNERLIRDMPFIDDARFIISPADPAGDSVDIMVITKDVFSIGFDLITISPGRSVFRLYDGNLLGMGDRLVNVVSMETHRAPFVEEQGVSYSLSNIGGTFIDGQANYFHDDNGNRNVGFQLVKNFISNLTKWAGSGLFQYIKDVNKVNDTVKIISYLHNESLWIGRSFLLKTTREPVRFIVSELAANRYYFSRPFTSPDSNKRYYNTFQLFSGFSVSRNNFYLANYVFELGKRENIPYGYLAQLTLGPEFNDYFTRFYGGIELAGGDFIKKFGYLSGRVSFGGYFHGNSYEDGIVKVQTQYMTYLFFTPGKRYRFRTYVSTDFRYGFNLRQNNKDFSNINLDLQIPKTINQNSLQGTGSLAVTLSTLVYTPWYFYGFRFALLGQVQAGVVTRHESALFANPLYSGFRAGLMIRNDNLIFPALVISLFVYPTTPSGGPWLQYSFDVNTGLKMPDFNVTGIKEETLQN